MNEKENSQLKKSPENLRYPGLNFNYTTYLTYAFTFPFILAITSSAIPLGAGE
jgi:hypothetical protein